MTRSAKPRYQPWDIVLVPFSYTEQNYAKVRPSKMATFEEPSFVKRIGTLSTKDRGKVSAQLYEFLCIEEKR